MGILAGQEPIFEVPSLRIHSTVQIKVIILMMKLATRRLTR